jgi:hypothetical protein
MGTLDVRIREHLDHDDVVSLNFVRSGCPFEFRRHFRQGLRSHVMEVLRTEDLERERRGIADGGIRRFPDARPVKMLRIFKSRFSNLERALEEIRRLRIVEAYLPPDLMARSEEFLVTYRRGDESHLLLCGLQEYVTGEVLDPWNLPAPEAAPEDGTLFRHAQRFVSGVKRMVLETGHVPDLAGIGNLFRTPAGRIVLVDINNISRIPDGSRLCLDDRGYPACDKSIEALALIERHLCGAAPEAMAAPPYDRFLMPERMREVRKLEQRFLEGLKRRDA